MMAPCLTDKTQLAGSSRSSTSPFPSHIPTVSHSLTLYYPLPPLPLHPTTYLPPTMSHLPLTTPHHPSPLPQGTRNQIGSYRTGVNKISHRWDEQTKKEYTNHTHVSAGHCMESVTNLNKEEVMVVSLIVFVSWIQRQDRMWLSIFPIWMCCVKSVGVPPFEISANL